MDLVKAIRRRSMRQLETPSKIHHTQAEPAKSELLINQSRRYTWTGFNETSSETRPSTRNEETYGQSISRPKSSGSMFRSSKAEVKPPLPDFHHDDRTSPRYDQRPRSRKHNVVTDMSTVASRSDGLPAILEKKYSQVTKAFQSRSFAPVLMRWDAATRTARPWNSLKKDHELIYDDGIVHIHFYEKEKSRRGPAISIPGGVIESTGFQCLFDIYLNHITVRKPQHLDFETKLHHCDFYIPAPEELSQEETTRWHINTRNFFAMLMQRPMVGTTLGQAIIGLKARLSVMRPKDPRNMRDIIAYLREMDYLDFNNCPDYALAVLNFAEHFQIRDLWIDAFAHCVGMQNSIKLSLEYQHISYVTHALISRESKRIQSHLDWATGALSNFLQTELSDSHLITSIQVQSHLHQFRQFLISFYVDKFGYWPPPNGTQFSRSMYKAMQPDFQELYHFLANMNPKSYHNDQTPAPKSIAISCILETFDATHGFAALPSSQPLLPSSTKAVTSRRSSGLLRRYKFAKEDTVAQMADIQESLLKATNKQSTSSIRSGLVKAYQSFEMDSVWQTTDRLSAVEARESGWLLIYTTLQILRSITSAPSEVRDTDTTYPLCCAPGTSPPWQEGRHILQVDYGSLSHNDLTSTSASSTPLHSPTIQPDHNALTNYFPLSQSNQASPSLKIAQPVRAKSWHTITSSTANSQRSKKNNATKPSATWPLPSPASKYREIRVTGYGNGLGESEMSYGPRALPSELSEEVLPEVVVSMHS